MDIHHKDDGKKGRFYVLSDGVLSAEMTYVWAGDTKIIIDHTEVDERWKGQGAGKQLLTKAVQFARDKNIKILPLCPFSKSVFEKTEELRDVI